MIPSRPIGRPCSVTCGTTVTMCRRAPARCEIDRNIAARGAAHDGNEIQAVGDRLAVDREQPVARTQTRARSRRCPAALTAPRYRRSSWPDRSPGPAAICPARSARAYPHRPAASRVRSAPSRRTRSGITPSSENSRSRSICSSSVSRDPVVADAHDLIAALETRDRGRAVETHLPDHRLDDLGAGHRQNRVQQRRRRSGSWRAPPAAPRCAARWDGA